MDLKNVSTNDLVAEMAKRKKEIERPKIKPDVFDEFLPLVECCESILDDIVKYGYSKDSIHYIYEKAMLCVYGEKIWDWVNKYENEG